MKQRIFIAINLPLKIKQELWQVQKKLSGSKTSPENLHITLQFLGYITAQQVQKLKLLVREAGEGQKKFKINLIKVCSVQNRMIWAEIKENLILSNLAKKFGNYRFSPHITLSRGRVSKLCKNIDLNFIAQNIDIMKSELRRSGAIYTKLWEYKLK